RSLFSVISFLDHDIRIIQFSGILVWPIVSWRFGHSLAPDNTQETDIAMKKSGTALPATPLAGVSVVDFGQDIAGPGAAMALAELGASVIKVEPLTGDQARHIGRYGESMVRAYN